MTDAYRTTAGPEYHDLLKMYRELPGENHGALLQPQWHNLPATPEMVGQLFQFAAEHNSKSAGLLIAYNLLLDEMAKELGTTRKRSTAAEQYDRDSEDREENDRILSAIHALGSVPHPLMQAADVCITEAIHAKRVASAMAEDAHQLNWALQGHES